MAASAEHHPYPDDLVYLNNAATGWPCAPGVASAVLRELTDLPSLPGRTSTGSDNMVEDCRSRLADLLGVSAPERIALVPGATHGLNMAIQGTGLDDSSHVVTTAMEHNSVLRPLYRVQSRSPGMRLTVVGLDADGALDREQFTKAMAEAPTALVMTHASNVTGHINPAAELLAQARAAGAVTVLDAAQTAGIADLRSVSPHSDVIVFTGHKALHGPSGIGAIYVADGLELEQTTVGGTGVRSAVLEHPPEMPIRLEAGTPNMPAVAGLCAALQWFETRGRDNAERAAALAGELRRGLAETRGVKCLGPADLPATPTVSFVLEGWDVADAGFALWASFGILCRTGLHCAPLIHPCLGTWPAGTIRFSLSGFTSEDGVSQAVQAVRRLAA